MTDIVTPEQLQNASLDAAALQTFINGSDSEDVITRLSEQYPTLAKAIKLLMETGGWNFYSTETELLAAAPSVAPSVAYAADTKKLYKYSIESGETVASWHDEGLSQLDLAKSYADQQVSVEKIDRESVINTKNTDSFVLYGSDDFEVGRIGKELVYFQGVLKILNTGNGVTFVGNDDFEIGKIGESAADAVIKKSQDNTLVVVGNDDFEVGRIGQVSNQTVTAIDISQPLFYAQPLCAFNSKPILINVPSLFAQRQEQAKTKQVIATLSGQSTQLSYSSRDQIYVPNLNEIGNSYLTLRDTTQYKITRIPVTAKVAATTGKSVVSPKILMIGDSITNRGLGDLINKYLTEYTYAPTFIGTIKGALDTESSTGTGGVLGEGREGWESGDYTYLVTDRAQIVAEGNEAAYLALDKSIQREYNAFIRAATSSDDSSIVRNGYVLDFAHYQSRFSLATPDIVVVQLGTNDIRDRDEPVLTAQFYSEMTLLIQRIRAAWANAKIILSLPNTPMNDDRDPLWKAEYTPVIRKLMQIRSDFASDGKVFLCPSWALSTSEAGYSITSSTATTDTLSGALVGTLADSIHPQYAARYQLAHTLAAYIACAADNII